MPTIPTPLINFRPVVLSDGSAVALRNVQLHDRPELLQFLKALSQRSSYLRFCSGGSDLAAIAADFVQIGPNRRGIVALGARGEIVGHAEYVRVSPHTAEVAVVVADAWQGRRLATRLLERLIEVAGHHGIARFTAEVLPENDAMLAVFTSAFSAAVTESDTGYSVEFGMGAQVPVALAA